MNYPKNFENSKLNEKWANLIRIRDICNVSIEEKRASKEIGSSLEANLEIELSKKIFDQCCDIDFAELCITSTAKLKVGLKEDIKVITTKAKGNKCPVCWKISEEKCIRHSA